MGLPRFIFYIVIGASLVLISHGVFVIWNEERSVDVSELLQIVYWSDVIERKGVEDAHDIFLDKTKNLVLRDRHDIAHAFGGALFEQEGLPALILCNEGDPERYSYGCFHEFLGHAIAEHGVPVVKELNHICINELENRWLTCQHGIGHGIQAHFGYQREDLDEALAVCDGLEKIDSIGGCYSGVFMEYNLRTVLGDEAAVRPFNMDILDDPCGDVAERHQQSCIFRLAEWWKNAPDLYDSGLSDTEIYAELGERCRSLDLNATHANICFGGIGRTMPRDVDNDIDTARMFCDAAAERDDELFYCNILVARRLADIGEGNYSNICDDFSGPLKARCVEYTDTLFRVYGL